MKTILKFYLFFIAGVTLVGGLASCYQVTDLPSASVNLKSIDDDDEPYTTNRFSDRIRNQEDSCEGRDFCRDLCDDIFYFRSSRGTCYDKDHQDVKILQEVYDVLSDSRVNKRNLESLDADDFGFYFSINDGGDDFVKIIEDSYDAQDSLTTLEWIAKDNDIASQIRSYDSENIILQTLMETQAGNSSDISQSSVSLTNHEFTVGSFTLSLNKDIRSFVEGFIYGYGSRSFSFIQYAGSRYEESIKLAHSTLVSVCEEAVSDDDDVKKCMLATYCLLDDWPNFFEEKPFYIDEERDDVCTPAIFSSDEEVDEFFSAT